MCRLLSRVSTLHLTRVRICRYIVSISLSLSTLPASRARLFDCDSLCHAQAYACRLRGGAGFPIRPPFPRVSRAVDVGFLLGISLPAYIHTYIVLADIHRRQTLSLSLSLSCHKSDRALASPGGSETTNGASIVPRQAPNVPCLTHRHTHAACRMCHQDRDSSARADYTGAARGENKRFQDMASAG
ncbi:hypothetical protein LX32DRAFT_644675 [Colletotrichum zoysiae]|uniref:Uncharacterized protein n=1 Tax=Colletotrichum zoysiae TaxID=1216348 RepID=A0AAD9LWI1_9PEZI|nr:hypothetical protein LX32DRAFT_644675 [Colletotrichum zoysiae]